MNATAQSVERERASTPILKPSSNTPAALTPTLNETDSPTSQPLDVGSLSQDRVLDGVKFSMANNTPDGGESMQGLAEMIQPASQPRTGDRSDCRKRDLFRGRRYGNSGQKYKKIPSQFAKPAIGNLADSNLR